MSAPKVGGTVTMTDGRRVTITDAPAMGNYDYAGILPDQTRIYLSDRHIVSGYTCPDCGYWTETDTPETSPTRHTMTCPRWP